MAKQWIEKKKQVSAVAERMRHKGEKHPRQTMSKSAVSEETDGQRNVCNVRLVRRNNQLCHICAKPSTIDCEGCGHYICRDHTEKCTSCDCMSPLCPACHVRLCGCNCQLCYICDKPSTIDCEVCGHYICQCHTEKCNSDDCMSPLCTFCHRRWDGLCKPQCDGYD